MTDVESIQQISHISQLSDILQQLVGQRLVCALDWDNTISQINGCDLPLRDPETVSVAETLNEMNITWFILTARRAGMNLQDPAVHQLLKTQGINTLEIPFQETFGHCVRWSVQQMHQALPPLKEQSLGGWFALNPPDVQELQFHHSGKAEPAVVYGSVVYSGSNGNSNKGRAVIKLMAQGVIPPASMFDYFIFLDNDLGHVQAMEEEFTQAGLRNKLIALYYPQEPFLETGPCEGSEVCPRYE